MVPSERYSSPVLASVISSSNVNLSSSCVWKKPRVSSPFCDRTKTAHQKSCHSSRLIGRPPTLRLAGGGALGPVTARGNSRAKSERSNWMPSRMMRSAGAAVSTKRFRLHRHISKSSAQKRLRSHVNRVNATSVSNFARERARHAAVRDGFRDVHWRAARARIRPSLSRSAICCFAATRSPQLRDACSNASDADIRTLSTIV